MRTRDTSTRDKGIAQVLLMRLETRRLPYALKLKEKVDRGEPLTILDTKLLKKVMDEAGEARRLAKKMPEYEGLVNKMADLYSEITHKAVENAKNPAPPPKPKDVDF